MKEDVTYGVGFIEGYVVNDDISITSNRASTAKDVNFINVYHAKNLSSLESDGLLGLSPRVSALGRLSGQDVHLLVDELKKDGVIDKAQFSMYLTTYDKQSRVYFGGYNQDIVDKSYQDAKKNDPSAQPIYWLPINSNWHW